MLHRVLSLQHLSSQPPSRWRNGALAMLCALLAASCGRDDRTARFFPLTSGIAWQYRVQRTTMDGERELRYIIGTARAAMVGDIQAAVVIENGKILHASIAQCLTRYSCNVIEHLIPQVAQRQSPDVDNVSRATQSADAFYYAVFEALRKSK